MDSDDLKPPKEIAGMMELNRDLFKKSIKIPKLKILEEMSNKVLSVLRKNYLLKMENLKPIFPDESNRVFLLHPQVVQSFKDLPVESLNKFGITEDNFHFDTLDLTYKNWRADEILKSIFPNDKAVTSFSRIGHIVHVNLQEYHQPYKKIIGEVLKDKTFGCRTVVNKINSIDNTYRTFQLELLYGEPDYQVETKENGNIYEFDFSKVYWNPRLSTEHERIILMLKPNDILYDVFAGVGPFSIPAAKKKCHVLANDLNPESFKWLNHNISRNKCQAYIKTCNKDGKDFILTDLKTDLKEKLSVKNFISNKIHITMNLPAQAVEFLNNFCNLFDNNDDDDDSDLYENLIKNPPILHVYCFSNDKSIVRDLVENNLGMKIPNEFFDGIYFVRNVAPNKDMYRASFYLTEKILCKKAALKRNNSNETDDIKIKKICHDI